jgi:hypothetical protein
MKWIALLLLTTSCGFLPDHELGTLEERDSFIAVQKDFEGFEGWNALELEGTAVEGIHDDGHRTVYINALPGEGEEQFAVGTIIMKTGPELHAMVKRGAGFNPDGAFGWEWFELGVANDGTPIILWRGMAPPAGEGYGCTPGTPCDENTLDCNQCHVGASANDYVHSIRLR